MHMILFIHFKLFSFALLLCFSLLEEQLAAGDFSFSLNDQAALLQLLSQAEKDHSTTNNHGNELDKGRLAVLEHRLRSGPLESSHLAVLQLLGQAEVVASSFFNCMKMSQ